MCETHEDFHRITAPPLCISREEKETFTEDPSSISPRLTLLSFRRQDIPLTSICLRLAMRPRRLVDKVGSSCAFFSGWNVGSDPVGLHDQALREGGRDACLKRYHVPVHFLAHNPGLVRSGHEALADAVSVDATLTVLEYYFVALA